MFLIKLQFKINKIFKLSYFYLNYGKKFKHKRIFFRKRFELFIENNGNVIIGNNCFFNNDCSINCVEMVKIGDDCIFGENVKIYDHNHKFNSDALIYNQGLSVSNVEIGNNVWIGSNVIILSGTKIGDNSVIGAGIVLSGIIPCDSVVKRNKSSYYIEKIIKEKT